MPGRLDFSFSFGGRSGRPREPEEPFRILVVGDFGGRGDQGAPAAPAPAVQRVDVDDLDGLLSRVGPRARLMFGAEPVELRFGSIDDFHPDALLRQLPELQRLVQQRERLQDPNQAAALLQRIAAEPATSPAAPPDPTTETALFERLLGARRSEPGAAAIAGLDALLARLVRPHLAPVTDPRVPDLRASLAASASGLLRQVLHHPAFQHLEATWRGLCWLLQNVECDEQLQVWVLDATLTELRGWVAGDDLRRAPLYQLLVERADAEARRFAFVALQHEFDASEASVRTLAALGALGVVGDFAVVGTAAPSILGCPSLSDVGDPTQWRLDDDAALRWQALRRSQVAPHIGLVLPRFLLRLPYGASTDSIEALPFEEMPMPPEHRRYLWGAPGLAVAMLLARSFRASGWRMQADAEREVGGLPAHTFRIDGQSRLQPCAEVLLSERAVAAAAAAGLMVLRSAVGRDAARLVQLRSLAEPPTALAGSWRD